MIFDTHSGYSKHDGMHHTCLSVSLAWIYGDILEVPTRQDLLRWNSLLYLTHPAGGIPLPGDVILYRKPCLQRGRPYDWRTSRGWQGVLRPVHASVVLAEGGDRYGEWGDPGVHVFSGSGTNHYRNILNGHPMYELRRKA